MGLGFWNGWAERVGPSTDASWAEAASSMETQDSFEISSQGIKTFKFVVLGVVTNCSLCNHTSPTVMLADLRAPLSKSMPFPFSQNTYAGVGYHIYFLYF
jgi:hypothetical protein